VLQDFEHFALPRTLAQEPNLSACFRNTERLLVHNVPEEKTLSVFFLLVPKLLL
jgi:hypothetical protein